MRRSIASPCAADPVQRDVRDRHQGLLQNRIRWELVSAWQLCSAGGHPLSAFADISPDRGIALKGKQKRCGAKVCTNLEGNAAASRSTFCGAEGEQRAPAVYRNPSNRASACRYPLCKEKGLNFRKIFNFIFFRGIPRTFHLYSGTLRAAFPTGAGR